MRHGVPRRLKFPWGGCEPLVDMNLSPSCVDRLRQHGCEAVSGRPSEQPPRQTTKSCLSKRTRMPRPSTVASAPDSSYSA